MLAFEWVLYVLTFRNDMSYQKTNCKKKKERKKKKKKEKNKKKEGVLGANFHELDIVNSLNSSGSGRRKNRDLLPVHTHSSHLLSLPLSGSTPFNNTTHPLFCCHGHTSLFITRLPSPPDAPLTTSKLRVSVTFD